jgi:cytochrome c553
MPRFFLFLGVLTLLSAPALIDSTYANENTDGDPELGARLYFQGLDSKGEPIKGVTRSDIPIDGSQMTCISCHRPSGMGSSEGGTYVPPIAASYLFRDRVPDRRLRNERFKEVYKELQGTEFFDDIRRGRLRPAYETPADIAQALRAGQDTAGRTLNPVMPRYDISDEDVANLTAFLKSNYATYDNGVEAERIHMATIIAGDVPQENADAVTDLVEAYAGWINKAINVNLARPGFSPYYRSEFVDSYRRWEPAIWRLTGDSSTWGEQLARYYEAQPAFFVTASLVQGDYSPIADFCDEKKMPCMLPITSLPRETDLEQSFTLYFSRGLTLEAKALAIFLSESDSTGNTVQIQFPEAESVKPAEAFTARMKSLTDDPVKTLLVNEADDLDAVLAKALAKKPKNLVFWAGQNSNKVVTALNNADLGETRVYLPSPSLNDIRASLSEDKHKSVRVTYPYDDPKNYHPESFRIRAWIGSRKLNVPDWTMMLQAYYSLKVSEFALSHLWVDYYGAYMIELTEHDLGVGFDPGPYPRLQLGPGQRFGSKGALVGELDINPSNPSGIQSISRWIIP